MILRHITRVICLPNIIKEGCLSPDYNPKRISSDKPYVSFQIYEGNDAFLQCYMYLRELKKDEVFELFFDAEKIKQQGLEIVDKFENGGRHTKFELQVTCVPEII